VPGSAIKVTHCIAVLGIIFMKVVDVFEGVLTRYKHILELFEKLKLCNIRGYHSGVMTIHSFGVCRLV
jgi:hypothetical protein